MTNMMKQSKQRMGMDLWTNYDEQGIGLSLCSLPVNWYQTEKGMKSSLSIGLPRISNSVQPKQQKKMGSSHSSKVCNTK